MFSLSDFTEYTGKESLKDKSVLVWNKQDGYYFMTFNQAQEAFKAGIQFIVKGVGV